MIFASPCCSLNRSGRRSEVNWTVLLPRRIIRHCVLDRISTWGLVCSFSFSSCSVFFVSSPLCFEIFKKTVHDDDPNPQPYFLSLHPIYFKSTSSGYTADSDGTKCYILRSTSPPPSSLLSKQILKQILKTLCCLYTIYSIAIDRPIYYENDKSSPSVCRSGQSSWADASAQCRSNGDDRLAVITFVFLEFHIGCGILKLT